MLGTRRLLEAHVLENLREQERTREALVALRTDQSKVETRITSKQQEIASRFEAAQTAHHSDNSNRFDRIEADAAMRFDKIQAMMNRLLFGVIGILLTIVGFVADHLFGKLM